jgi:ubiquinone/menaquinone biosynthesis C-methylase UbiE
MPTIMSEPANTIKLSHHATSAKAMYDARAPSYDASNGGWHVDLGREFVEWSKPSPGARILDLACGTGLVTSPAAQAAGPDGLVVAVDVSGGMLEAARGKPVAEGSARIKWVEHDITQLDDVEAVREVVRDGGFDLITCCSAFVLLDDPGKAIKHWALLLKRGGKIIIDVPTEDRTLHRLGYLDLRKAVGLGLPFDPDWIQDIDSLESLYRQAGLEIEKSWRTGSYLPEKWYKEDEAEKAFEENILKDAASQAKGKLDEARKVWPEVFKTGLRDDGRVWAGHALYVTVGVKK